MAAGEVEGAGAGSREPRLGPAEASRGRGLPLPRVPPQRRGDGPSQPTHREIQDPRGRSEPLPLSLCVFFFSCPGLYFSPSVCCSLSVHLCVSLSLCICRSLYFFISPSLPLYVSIPIRQPLCLYGSQSLFLPISLSVSQSPPPFLSFFPHCSLGRSHCLFLSSR